MTNEGILSILKRVQSVAVGQGQLRCRIAANVGWVEIRVSIVVFRSST